MKLSENNIFESNTGANHLDVESNEVELIDNSPKDNFVNKNK